MAKLYLKDVSRTRKTTSANSIFELCPGYNSLSMSVCACQKNYIQAITLNCMEYIRGISQLTYSYQGDVSQTMQITLAVLVLELYPLA